jgi:hypothetical protein
MDNTRREIQRTFLADSEQSVISYGRKSTEVNVQAESVNAFSFTVRLTDKDFGFQQVVVRFRGTFPNQVVILPEQLQFRHCDSP